jgi:hypothetical protein
MTIPKELRERIKKVTAKRPRTVLDHILKHGHITTEELRDTYGYNHPPRAARDVREHGITLETFRVTGSDGRKIAAYRFATTAAREKEARGGRQAFPKSLKKALLARDGEVCQICSAQLASRYLQIDHRVPYEIAGDTPGTQLRAADFMLLCGSCNRAKSWSCEHCHNRSGRRLKRICQSCYWASPKRYAHIAMSPSRRLDLVWLGDGEVAIYNALEQEAQRRNISVRELILAYLQDVATRSEEAL